MFLTRCRTHGIIPQVLRVILPVRSAKAGNIVEKTSHTVIQKRIGKVHWQKVMLARHIKWLDADLSWLLDADEWPRIAQLH